VSNPQSPDLLVLFTALLALVFSPALAAVLAPYVVIITGALLGTGWALRRRPPDSRAGAWAFGLLMMGTALVFTMPSALWLQHYLPGSYQWLLAPLAAAIAAVGDDWPSVGTWAVQLLGRVIARKAGDASS
jgi:hypothetical protein